ncbi:MAG TPA: FtsX-like permease family protein [Gemmataceae bacterium]|jgi:putative ABC transport system permease protein
MVPLSYNYRNLKVRWKTTLMTALGFTLVVAALVVMLAFVNGIRQVCATSGEPENVLLLSKGSHDEVLSAVTRHQIAAAEHSEGVMVDDSGFPLASRELFLVVHHLDEKTGAYRFLQVRGVLPVAFQVHTRVRVSEGETFHPNQSEVLIGKVLQRDHGLKVGDSLKIGRKSWKIAGVFVADGSAFESEVWGDLNELAGQFRREGYSSSVVLRAADEPAARALAAHIAASRNISLESQTEPQYYAKQAEQTRALQQATWMVAWFMGLGAIFGVMNTMFAAINHRLKDIAVMRLMGFKPRAILMSFLIEAVLIAALGGLLGLALGSAANGATRSISLGSRNIQFALRVDATIVTTVAIVTLILGILGGLLPAMNAMRVKVLEALH